MKTPRRHPDWIRADRRRKTVEVSAEKQPRKGFKRRKRATSYARASLHFYQAFKHIVHALMILERLDPDSPVGKVDREQCSRIVHLMDDNGLLDLRTLKALSQKKKKKAA